MFRDYNVGLDNLNDIRIIQYGIVQKIQKFIPYILAYFSNFLSTSVLSSSDNSRYIKRNSFSLSERQFQVISDSVLVLIIIIIFFQFGKFIISADMFKYINNRF